MLNGIDQVFHPFIFQKGVHHPLQLGSHTNCFQIFPFVHVVEASAVEDDDGKGKLNIGQQLADGGRGLDGGDGKAATVFDQTVELNLGIAGNAMALFKDRVLNAGDEKRVGVAETGEVETIDEFGQQDADDGVEGTMEGIKPWAHIIRVIYGDTEKDHGGKIGHIRDFEDNGEIDDDNRHEAHDQIVVHLVRNPIPQKLLLDQQGQKPPYSADDRADDAPPGDGAHAARILLNTLESRNYGIEGHSLLSADLIDRKAEKNRRQRAEDPLAGDRKT